MEPGSSSETEEYKQRCFKSSGFWLTNLLSGFIIEFVVDTVKAYSEVEHHFFKGYRGKFLNSLNLWIKMLLCDKGFLQLRSDL